MPILFVGAGKDCVNPITETHRLYKLAEEPKELMVIEEATHFELYSGEHFTRVIEKEIEWFNKFLK